MTDDREVAEMANVEKITAIYSDAATSTGIKTAGARGKNTGELGDKATSSCLVLVEFGQPVCSSGPVRTFRADRADTHA